MINAPELSVCHWGTVGGYADRTIEIWIPIEKNNYLCRLYYTGGIFATELPTGSWIKWGLIKPMRYCIRSCISVEYNCSCEKTNARCFYDYNQNQ